MNLKDSLNDLLGTLGINENDTGGSISIVGENTYLPSPHYAGEANTIAAAAHGATAAALWKQRTGDGQDVTVDIADGIHGIHSIDFIKQNGIPIKLNVIREDITQFYQTKNDRWIFFTGAFPELRDGILKVLGCANNRESLTQAVATWDPFELEDALAEKNMIAAIARTAQEWAAHPQGQALAQTPTIDIGLIAPSEPIPLKTYADRPLSGIKVLDLSRGLAGPAIAKNLAEFGADVLRLQSSTQNDPLAMILETDWGKRSAFLHFDDEKGLAKLKSLMSEADIIVDGLRPGSLASKGLTPEYIASIKPGMIYVSMNCYGYEGPWIQRGGFDQQTQCVSGMAIEEGSFEKPKLMPTYYLSLRMTSFFGSAGAMSALLSRVRKGGSYHVKVSMTKCAMWVQAMGLRKDAYQDFNLDNIPTPKLVTLNGPFGDMQALAPIAQLSKTPAFWANSPQPWGASYPEWWE